MGLAFYHADLTPVTTGEQAIVASLNGTTGETEELLVYIRNDDPLLYFTNIELWPEDSDIPDSTLGIYGNGWGIKLSAGARQPTPDEWEGVLAGDVIDIPNIGTTTSPDTTTYQPFWIKVIVPGYQQAQTKTSIQIKFRAISHPIGS